MTENIWKKERFFMQIFQLFFWCHKKSQKEKELRIMLNNVELMLKIPPEPDKDFV